MKKSKLKIGDIVKYYRGIKNDTDGYIYGIVTKIYESTFGSKIKDTAVQIKPIKNNVWQRNRTTFRIKNVIKLTEKEISKL